MSDLGKKVLDFFNALTPEEQLGLIHENLLHQKEFTDQISQARKKQHEIIYQEVRRAMLTRANIRSHSIQSANYAADKIMMLVPADTKYTGWDRHDDVARILVDMLGPALGVRGEGENDQWYDRIDKTVPKIIELFK